MTDEQKAKLDHVQAEAGFSVNWTMKDKAGVTCQMTMRAASAADWLAVLQTRAEMMDKALSVGWTVGTAGQPAPERIPTGGGVPDLPPDFDNYPAPAAQPAPANRTNGHAQPAQAVEATESFQAETLVGSVADGKVFWKVKGGKFSQWGVTVWPETLKAAGFDVAQLNPATPGGYSLAGFTAHYTLKDDGKAKKIVRLTK